MNTNGIMVTQTLRQKELQDSRRNIKISLDTYNILKHQGFVGESFDTVIRRLLIKKDKKDKATPDPKYNHKI